MKSSRARLRKNASPRLRSRSIDRVVPMRALPFCCDQQHAETPSPAPITEKMTMRTTPSIKSPRNFGLHLVIAAALLLTTTFTINLSRAEPRSDNPAAVVFVCLHGSVKS